MRRYLANTFLCFTVLASGLGFAHAQERQTSFTPTDALSAPPDEISQPIVITAPVLAPPGTASAAQPTRPVASPVATTPPAPTNTPTAPTPTTVAPTARAAAFAPAKAGVEATALDALDPDAGGLLSTANGSLGANMWQDTPRALVDRLLPELSLPTNSAALNNLARRLLLTTAQLPNGKSANTRSLTSMRVEKLLTLGNSAEAWQLAHLNKMERLDDLTLRMMTEAVVLNNDVKDICGQVPGLMVGHDGLEWQKMMVVCQLRSGDNKAAQLSVDVMREQSVKDDIFLSLINKNIFNTSKLLPRQLTPLKPMNLALLRQIDLPLPTELFGRPDTVLAQQTSASQGRRRWRQTCLCRKIDYARSGERKRYGGTLSELQIPARSLGKRHQYKPRPAPNSTPCSIKPPRKNKSLRDVWFLRHACCNRWMRELKAAG